MFGAHLDGGMDAAIKTVCISPTSSSSQTTVSYANYPYTSIPSIDTHPSGPCPLIATFHLALDARESGPKTFLAYLLGTGVPLILVPWVEVYRSGQKRDWRLLAYPTLWLLLTQAVTVGVTYQVYWLLLILSRGTGETERRKVRMTRIEAEALAIGLFLGAGIPSAAMVLTPHPMVTWAWQFYPVYMTLLRSVYLQYRKPARKDSNTIDKERKQNNGLTTDEAEGRGVLKTIYLTTFALSAGVHLFVAWPYVSTGNFDDLRALLVPTLISSSQTALDGSGLVHNFFKWDYELGYAATVLGLMFSARGKTAAMGIAAWCALSAPFIGIGAAVTGVFAWRDLKK